MLNKNNKLVYLILFVIVAVNYGHSIYFDFVAYDDHDLVLQNTRIRDFSWQNLKAIFTPKLPATYQPIREFSYMLNYSISGLKPWSYHLVNILLYFFCLILLYKTLMVIFEGKKFIPIFSVLLYAVHPIHVEAVTWISARKEVLMLFFFLASFLFYLHYRYAETRKNKPWLLLASFVAFSLSILSKPTAIMLPFVFLVYEGIYFKIESRNIKYYVGFALISIAIFFYFSIYTGLILKTSSFYPGVPIKNIFLNIGHYLKTLVFPVSLAAHYELLENVGISHPLILAGGLAAALSILLFIKGNKHIKFFTAWFYLNLIPVLGFVKVSIPRADRYVLLSSISFCVLLAFLVSKAVERAITKKSERMKTIIKASIASVLIIILSFLTIQQNKMWRDTFVLFEKSYQNSPSLGFGLTYATHLSMKGKDDQALALLNEIKDHHGSYYKTYRKIGEIYFRKENYNEADKNFAKALLLSQSFEDSVMSLENLVKTRIRLNELESAIGILNILYDRTGSARYLQDMAAYYIRMEEYHESLKLLKRVLKLNPDDELGLLHLGYTYYKLGNFTEAQNILTRFLELYPENDNIPQVRKILEDIKKRGG